MFCAVVDNCGGLDGADAGQEVQLLLFLSMRPEPCSVSAADTAASPRETATGPSLFPRAARTPAENSSAAASTAAEDRVKPLTPGASLAFF